MVKLAGPPCPGCGFPIFTDTLRLGDTARCPACSDESEVISEKVAGNKSATSNGAVKVIAALGFGGVLIAILTRAGKGNAKVR